MPLPQRATATPRSRTTIFTTTTDGAFARITNMNPGVPAMQELLHRFIEERNIMGRMQRTLTSAIYISTLLAAAVLWPIPLLATNYTVKSGGGGNYSTIQQCATAMASGDTCTVFAGTYNANVTVPAGTAGNYKTITVNGSDVVSVTGSFTLNSYTKVSGFVLNHTGSCLSLNSSATNVIIGPN